MAPKRRLRETPVTFSRGITTCGERAGTRTQDLLIKSQLLYRLSYALVTKGRMIQSSGAKCLDRAVGAV